jgi:ubiquinone/menaquinone biosynthesis C-methylase UbiE
MIIDIGSGPWPRANADIKMDLYPWPQVNCIHDLMNIPYPFESKTFDKAYMCDVIEHIHIFDIDKVLTEVHRILKPQAVFEVTVPDAYWIFERIIYNDWEKEANVAWLNPTNNPWKNAMSYLFGGFHNEREYKIPGMGHVNAFNFDSLKELLENNGFKNIERITDDRNPKPACNSVLKIICLA